MKKINLLLLLFFTTLILSAQTNILDGDLNNWSLRGTAPYQYYQPTNGFLMTLNELYGLPEIAGGPGPVTVERTADVKLGAWAAKLTSKIFQLGAIPIFVPGILGTTRLDIAAQTIYLGRAYTYTEKPRRFKGYYKYQPVNGDSCLVMVLLTKHNSISNRRDTLGFVKQSYTETVSTYTQFDLLINYTDDVTTPDSITIICGASAAINFVNLQQCSGQPLSTMYVDELSFGMQAGIEMPLQNDASINMYPIPSKDIININSSRNLNNPEIKVYDINGKLLMQKELNTKNSTIDINNLQSGKYLYQICENKHVIHAGSFIVNK